MYFSKLIGIISIFYSLGLFAQSDFLSGSTVQVSADKLMELQRQQWGGKGCLQTMIEQVSEGTTAAMEVKQNQSSALMGAAERYFSHAQTCDNEIKNQLDSYREAKLEHEKYKRMLSIKIRRQEQAYRKALNSVMQQCEANSLEEWKQLKAQHSSGMQNSGTRLIGSTDRINNLLPLFEQNCMARQDTIRQSQELSEELQLNLDEVNAGFDNSVSTLRSATEGLQLNQEMAIKRCLQAKELEDYNYEMIRNQISDANSHLKKQNVLGLLGASYTCLQNRTRPTNDTTRDLSNTQ